MRRARVVYNCIAEKLSIMEDMNVTKTMIEELFGGVIVRLD